MPNIPRIGISKKIEDRDERARLKRYCTVSLPEGMGAIIRTTLKSDKRKKLLKIFIFWLHTWNQIQEKFKHAQPKEKIYEDIELPLQIVRDHLDDDVEEVITDNKEGFNKNL